MWLEKSPVMAGGFSFETRTLFSKNFEPLTCCFHTPLIPPEMQPSYCLLVNKEVLHLQALLLKEEKQVSKYSETGAHP